jgi:hypothetical protein
MMCVTTNRNSINIFLFTFDRYLMKWIIIHYSYHFQSKAMRAMRTIMDLFTIMECHFQRSISQAINMAVIVQMIVNSGECEYESSCAYYYSFLFSGWWFFLLYPGRSQRRIQSAKLWLSMVYSSCRIQHISHTFRNENSSTTIIINNAIYCVFYSRKILFSVSNICAYVLKDACRILKF